MNEEQTTTLAVDWSIGAAQSPKIGKLAAALAEVQKNMRPANKSCVNPYFKSTYADLGEVWAVIREPLAENHLAVIQTTGHLESGTPVLVTTLVHS